MMCSDCTPRGIGWGPMLHDEVWATIATPEEFLCIIHIEERLKREIRHEDLTMCPLNATALLLTARLEAKTP